MSDTSHESARRAALERARALLDQCPDKTCWCSMCQDARALLAEHARAERLKSYKEAHAELSEDYQAMLSDRTALEAEVATLRGVLLDAAEDIESWGAYAGEYFQQKHDLAGCVARYRDAALSTTQGAKATADGDGM